MNPLDLPGPQFLGLYVGLYLLAFALAAVLRWLLSLPGGDARLEAWDLLPYEAAYLRGGEPYAVDAAIVRLIHAGALVTKGGNGALQAVGPPPPANGPRLEQVIYEAVSLSPGRSIWSVRLIGATVLAPLRQRLESLGLLVPPGQAALARFAPMALVLAVVGLGALKIGVGVLRDRPVAILVVLCLLSAGAAYFTFRRPLFRSRRGNRALDWLQADNAAMRSQAERRIDGWAGDDLVLAVGLFGMGILASGPLSDLPGVFRRTKDPSSGSPFFGDSSWGGSSCGGAGCGGGGGCGGCGGCSG